MKTNLLYAAILLLILFSSKVQAQDGKFDVTFGINGILTLPAGNGNNDVLSSIVVQPDGKYLLGGYSRTGIPLKDKFYIGRLLQNGTYDTTFNNGLPKTFSDSANTTGVFVALRADGGIMYGGSRGGYRLATAGRLNANGSDVVTPVGPFPITASSYNVSHSITSMSYNRVTDKLMLGGHMSAVPYPMIGFRFRSDLSLDGNFNGGGRINLGGSNYVFSFDVLSQDDGTSLFICNKQYGGTFTVVKLLDNGSPDNNFGTNGEATVSIDPSYGEPRKIMIHPDGNILVCGGGAIGSGRFSIIRLRPDGAHDNSFSPAQIATSGANNYFTSMVVQPDGKIIASGVSVPFTGGGSSGVVVRYKTDGKIDSTFGTNGSLTIPNVFLNSSAISVSERSIILVGKNTSSQMVVIKIKYEVQPYNILGKDIVSVETESKYVIHPAVTGHSYIWNYSSSNVYTLGSSIDDTLTLYFNKTSPSGILSCSVFDAFGNLLKKVYKFITVNPEPSLAQQLSALECSPAQTYATDWYINSFSIVQTKVSTSNTGASPSGYNDLTASSDYDTLFIGDNYQASLECVRTGSTPLYCGIWIDFDNNGKMDGGREFVGSAVSEGKNFTVNNIIIPVDASVGPKRFRVKIRQSGPFSANDFCLQNEEVSETEDYLVVLAYYQGIKAPNFITPNNDGKNDNFVVRGVKEGLNNSLKVFNRVGDLVYDVENYDNSWSGLDKNGGTLKPGTYYYVFTQTSTDKSKDEVVKGFFEIRY